MLPVDAVKQLNAEPAKRQFASGQWIDIIPLIEPKLDKWDIKDFTGANKWSRVESDLVSGYDDQPSKLILPLDADWKSYECEIEFTRRRGYAPAGPPSCQGGRTGYVRPPSSTPEGRACP